MHLLIFLGAEGKPRSLSEARAAIISGQGHSVGVIIEPTLTVR